MKSVTSRLIGFVFCRLFLCAIAIVLIALALERGSIFYGVMGKWLFLFGFAFAVCMLVTFTVVQQVRKITEQTVKKFSDDAFETFAKTSANLEFMADVLRKNASLMNTFVHMITDQDDENNDASE